MVADTVREVSAGVSLIPLSFPGPLRSVNVYLIESRGERALVDAGWEFAGAGAWDELVEALRALGVPPRAGALQRLVLTHIHPDHVGMAERIKHTYGCRILMHGYERVFLKPRYHSPQGLLEHMAEWLDMNGVPDGELQALRDASLAMTGARFPDPDETLRGGETLPVGSQRWRVLWTPGHAAGHICLYEPAAGLLITGDHVLPGETPNISLHPQTTPNPLADFVDSLRAVRRLPVTLALPGHGDPFSDLAARVDQTLSHHRQRLQAIQAVLGPQPKTTWEVALSLRWTSRQVRFESLDVWNRRLALLETLAHLEYLRAPGWAAHACVDPGYSGDPAGEGGVRKEFSDGVMHYYVEATMESPTDDLS